MKITLSNLGPLEYAEFSLGEMTIVCGSNNTGKTYAAYALYGFLHSWKRFIRIRIAHEQVSELFNSGVISIDLQPYIQDMGSILVKGCKAYSKELPKVFATSEDKLQKAKFIISLEEHDNNILERYERQVGSAQKEQISLVRSEGSSALQVTLLREQHQMNFPHAVISSIISETIAHILFSKVFPKPFIASAERTGAAIFRKELNFARNRLLKEMSQTNKNIDPFELFLKSYQDYALPVEEDVDFIRQLESLSKQAGFLQKHHAYLLQDFSEIIGGKYKVTKGNELCFIPNKQRIQLTMDESSSAVRSLLGIGFYLRHAAKPGDLLIIDEPELNLHPENQRKIARLFARLVNIGIQVFITTHSDYIIKELNTLIMLNNSNERIRAIAKEEKYHPDELMNHQKIKVYMAEKALIKKPQNQKRTQCQTLLAASIDEDNGIEVKSFDTAIDSMNRIQDAILWG